jgi:hypothetical protein
MAPSAVTTTIAAETSPIKTISTASAPSPPENLDEMECQLSEMSVGPNALSGMFSRDVPFLLFFFSFFWGGSILLYIFGECSYGNMCRNPDL